MNNTDWNVLFFSSFCSLFYAHAILIVNPEFRLFESTSLFLGSDSLLRSFASTGIGLGSLSSNRKAFAMPETLITPNVHLAFDILGNLTAKISFNGACRFDSLTKFGNFVIC